MGMNNLAEECISLIISFTSPPDACRLAVVSPTFRSAAYSDAVWEKFLPSDHREIIASSLSPPPSTLLSLSKKDLYFHLCHQPLLIGNGHMSFALERKSGKKCYMVGARDLSIIWGGTPAYWKWRALPESRFPEVAVLDHVWWLDIKGKINSRILSPGTRYEAYIVFKFGEYIGGFRSRPVNVCVGFEGRENGGGLDVFLDPPRRERSYIKERDDGWMETRMGSFFNVDGDDGDVICSLMEVDNYTIKSGLIVQGIEFGPA